jgi:hypothetical protein
LVPHTTRSVCLCGAGFGLYRSISGCTDHLEATVGRLDARMFVVDPASRKSNHTWVVAKVPALAVGRLPCRAGSPAAR